MKITTRGMILTALFAALTAVGAFIRIPVGPVPITLQAIFTLLAGLMLGARVGAMSQLIYVLLGLVGLPIFADGTGGLNHVISPSFGYLIGFIISAFIIGKIVEHIEKVTFIKMFGACILGIIIIYLIGIPYLYIILKSVLVKNITFQYALKIGFVVFIPGDLLKAVIASLLAVKVVPILRKQGMLENRYQ
ncbi:MULTISPECIES: biotin transporter BioY [Clostridium]|uniref:biotin transporter BioY n=1 Tax=Clostridium TaxID=1485 RepID=UPI0002886B9C|nr:MULTISPECIES: biotin transporter BioY [Clostridium]